MSETHKQTLKNIKKVMLKIGSNILVDSKQGAVNKRFIEALAASIKNIEDKEIVIVTSGAVGAGMLKLGYKEKPSVIPEKQTCASVGQIELMHVYSQAFANENITVGQVLLSAEDFRHRDRYKNLQNMIHLMLSKKIIPIINENDSVATAEIKVGDNDKLSSDVALFLDADLLLLFTDEDGLFDDNPKINPKAKLIPLVSKIDESILSLAGDPNSTGSAVSTGGMYSKLKAIKAVVESGCHAFLANGRRVLPHSVFLDESTVGTFFMASHKRLSSRKRWLTFVSSPKGSLVVDAGGIRALKNTHSSLLPVGILSVVHQFDAGDLVNVLDESGNLVARGITKYDSETLRLLLRKKTYEIHALLGDKAPEEVIHKNDLVLLA